MGLVKGFTHDLLATVFGRFPLTVGHYFLVIASDGFTSVSSELATTEGGQRTTVVLDTCVLLADPSSLTAFPDCDVVLPLTVVEELDSHKSRLDDVGRAARAVARELEGYRVRGGGSLQTPVPTLDSATIRIELNGIRTDKLTQYGLKAEKADNRILAAVLGLADKNPVTRFVSVDVNMRLKAAALGLHAEDWTHRTKRPAHEAGWCELEATPDVIDALFKSGETPAPDDCTAQDNEFVVLHHGSQSALTRRNGDMLRRLTKSPRAWGLAPRSKEQMFALDLLLDPEVPVVSLAGPAGTGKTILALAAALEQTFEPSMRRYDRLMILRPVIAVGRQELGFLPGDVEQKLGPWFEAVIDAMVALGDKVSHADARRTLDMWTGQGSLTMEAVTFLRGRSLQRTFVLVDEAQNLEAPLTLKTILTRVGEGSKVVFLGDTTQIDNPYAGAESNALAVLESRFAGSSLFGHVTLTKGERSKVADLAAQVL